jgi:hypothetical protein
MGRNRPKFETFQASGEAGYFHMLADHFKNVMKLEDHDIKNYIRANNNVNPQAFDPYILMSEECKNVYHEWKKTRSTKANYFSEVLAGISFIENFCIKNSIDFDTYRYKYSMKHVREKRFDWAIAVRCDFIDISRLKRVEKMLLKNYIDQYNIILRRLNNQDLANLIDERILEMKELLQEISSQVNK